MPLNTYQTYQNQNFPQSPKKKFPIVVIIMLVIIAVVVFLYILGSSGKDVEVQTTDTLSEQEKLEILNSLSDESIIKPSVDERMGILEEMSINYPQSSGGNNDDSSIQTSKSLSEEERLQVLESLRFQ
jgi:preprotein translocase subunit SecF